MTTINPSNQQISNHSVLVGAANNLVTNLAVATTGTVLQGNTGADPSFSTATYPSSATGTGTLLRADGTNWNATTSTYPNTNAANTLLYASSANVMAALATANGGVLTTDSSGVPSIDTTNFVRQTTGMQVKGNNTNTASPAGFIGEIMSAAVTSGSAQALTHNTAKTITSITLTPGNWLISCIGAFSGTPTGGTQNLVNISTTTNSITGNEGDAFMTMPTMPTASTQVCFSIPNFPVSIASNTTYYLVLRSLFSGGSISGFGRINAVRVG